MPCFIASPERGAIRPYVPCGHCICIPVWIFRLSPGFIVIVLLAYKSCPAACWLPRVGILAVSVVFLIRADIFGVVDEVVCHSGVEIFMYHSPFRGYSGMTVDGCLSLS